MNVIVNDIVSVNVIVVAYFAVAIIAPRSDVLAQHALPDRVL